MGPSFLERNKLEIVDIFNFRKVMLYVCQCGIRYKQYLLLLYQTTPIVSSKQCREKETRR